VFFLCLFCGHLLVQLRGVGLDSPVVDNGSWIKNWVGGGAKRGVGVSLDNHKTQPTIRSLFRNRKREVSRGRDTQG